MKERGLARSRTCNEKEARVRDTNESLREKRARFPSTSMSIFERDKKEKEVKNDIDDETYGGWFYICIFVSLLSCLEREKEERERSRLY